MDENPPRHVMPAWMVAHKTETMRKLLARRDVASDVATNRSAEGVAVAAEVPHNVTHK